jgi:hypothetical protein
VVSCSDVERFVDRLGFVIAVLDELASQERFSDVYSELLRDVIVKLAKLKFGNGNVKVSSDWWQDTKISVKCDDGEVLVTLTIDQLWGHVLLIRSG